MSMTDQSLVEAFRQANGTRFAETSAMSIAPEEHAVATETISPTPPLGVAEDDAPDAPPNDTLSLIGLLNRQAAGIESEASDNQNDFSSQPSAIATEPWQPALEVDHFAWPPIVDTVLSTAGETIGRFAERLGKDARDRTQLIAILGNRAESGATTMTLSLARLFAAKQLSVVLVDLDEANPGLAQALGVRPMISWLATLDEGVAIEEVLIESVNDKISLSPLCEPAGPTTAIDATTVNEQFWLPLANHFNVILADCGTAANSEQLATTLSAAGVSELVVVADNRCDDGTVAELARPLLERIRPDHWSVIRNFSDV